MPFFGKEHGTNSAYGLLFAGVSGMDERRGRGREGHQRGGRRAGGVEPRGHLGGMFGRLRHALGARSSDLCPGRRGTGDSMDCRGGASFRVLVGVF